MINDYIRELLEGNKKQNLISRRATEKEIREHVADSEYLTKVIDLKGLQVLDMGSGQGFPAIPLAIGEPESSFVLVESDLKKSMFLKELVFKLGLRNVEVIGLVSKNLGKRAISEAGLIWLPVVRLPRCRLYWSGGSRL